ncbi:MAG: hypothetical protein KGZ79_12425 [Dethiobacter sp.]|jgi:hypothetical protein|nr:hypothetical protein [Dethiobacter sp.]
MGKDPYRDGLLKKNPYAKKVSVSGHTVVVLESKIDNRELTLIPAASRAVKKYDIHELIFTDELTAGPGATVNRIAYGGFVEIETGGVLIVGEKMYCQGRPLGEIAGFDETHTPNHLNIVLKSDLYQDGVEMGLELGDELVFRTGC